MSRLKQEGFEEVKVGDGFLQFVIRLQSLCRILEKDEIREDFLNGKVIQVGSPDTILCSLDAMWCVLFPSWDVLKHNNSDDIEASEIHLNLLWQGSAGNFDLITGSENFDLFSYNAWTEALDEIFNSNYWLAEVQQVSTFLEIFEISWTFSSQTEGISS